MTIFRLALLAVATLSSGAALSTRAQQTAPAAAPMFSGVVTAISETSITAARVGSKDSKTFAITSETKFEGPKPRVSSRVTIRYVAAEDGDRAVRVIVRENNPEK